MANELFFFLTRDDLVNILQNVERNVQLKYIEAKAYADDDIKEYISLMEYDELGINKSGDHQSEGFLVLEKNEKLILREVQQVDGTTKYFVDQLKNENSVTFWPGGMHKEKYLICGHVGTVNTSESSKRIFKLFQKFIKKRCKTKVGRYYIGNDAINLNGNLRFITISVNQPKEYDIKI